MTRPMMITVLAFALAARARADGVSAGPIQTLVAQVAAATGIEPRVASTRDGATLVAWIETVNGSSQIRYRAFDRSGVAVGVPHTINGSGLLSLDAAGGGSRFMVSWEDSPGAGASHHDLRFRILDWSGATIASGNGEPASLAPIWTSSDSACTATPYDGFALTWIRRDANGIAQQVVVRRFDAFGGSPDPVPLTVETANQGFGAERTTACALWPDGHMLVAWVDGPQGAGPSVPSPDGYGAAVVGVYFATGPTVISGMLLIAGETAGDQTSPRLAASYREIAVLGFTSTATGVSEASVARLTSTGQIYDPSGLTLTATRAGPQVLTDVAVAASGESAIAFVDAAPTASAAPRAGFVRLRSPIGYAGPAIIETGLLDASPAPQGRASVALDSFGGVKAAWTSSPGAADELRFRTLDRSQVVFLATPTRGAVVPILLDSPSDPAFTYFLIASTNLGPTAVDDRIIRLGYDPLAQWILSGPQPNFPGFAGTLDSTGRSAAPALVIPNLTWLAGQTLHFAFVTVDPFGLAPSGLNTISESTTVVIQ